MGEGMQICAGAQSLERLQCTTAGAPPQAARNGTVSHTLQCPRLPLTREGKSVNRTTLTSVANENDISAPSRKSPCVESVQLSPVEGNDTSIAAPALGTELPEARK